MRRRLAEFAAWYRLWTFRKGNEWLANFFDDEDPDDFDELTDTFPDAKRADQPQE